MANLKTWPTLLKGLFFLLALVSPLMAALLVQYAAWSWRAKREAVLDVDTILPPVPRLIILLAHSCAKMKGARTFT